MSLNFKIGDKYIEKVEWKLVDGITITQGDDMDVGSAE